MSVNIRLLDCPFCGSEATIAKEGDRFGIGCIIRDCFAWVGRGFSYHYSDIEMEDAIFAWNSRDEEEKAGDRQPKPLTTDRDPWGNPHWRDKWTEFRPTGRVWLAQECDCWEPADESHFPEWLQATKPLTKRPETEMLHYMIAVDPQSLAVASDLINDTMPGDITAKALRWIATSHENHNDIPSRTKAWRDFAKRK